MKKRIISLVLALAMCLSLCAIVFAEDTHREIAGADLSIAGQLVLGAPVVRCIHPSVFVMPDIEENAVNGGQFGGVYYRKKDTSMYYEWSKPARVSDNVSGSLAGATVYTNQIVTYSASYTGAVGGLSFTGEKSISTETGYSFNVPAGVTAYIAHKCFFAIETGTRETVSEMTGKVVKTETYTAKIPQYGEYYLFVVK